MIYTFIHPSMASSRRGNGRDSSTGRARQYPRRRCGSNPLPTTIKTTIKQYLKMDKQTISNPRGALIFLTVGAIRAALNSARNRVEAVNYLLDEMDEKLTEGELDTSKEYKALVGIRDGLEEVIVKAQKYTSIIKNENKK